MKERKIYFVFSILQIENVRILISIQAESMYNPEDARFESDASSQSFVTLPIEIIYHILDSLDTLTIFLAFRNVCRRFNDITNNYHRYKVKFIKIERRSISIFLTVIHFVESQSSKTQ